MYKIGMDMGSTTIKAVVLDSAGNTVYSIYERHQAKIKEKACQILERIHVDIIGSEPVTFAVTGSGALGIAEELNIAFIQEVAATEIAVQKYPQVIDVVIELGGEDAKILFLTDGLEMRMNGSCAGGTGAFIDQMAVLLGVSVEQLDELSLNGTRVYPIASRCGVFAKTDIQPLLNQAVAKEDVAISIFHAVVNQTIGGLAQGRNIVGNVMFLGGPLHFLQGLRKSFIDTLSVNGVTSVFPENGQFYVALGAAWYAEHTEPVDMQQIIIQMKQPSSMLRADGLKALFYNLEEYEQFQQRHRQATIMQGQIENYDGPAWIGVDAGSTTLKVVVIGQEDEILFSKYCTNNGNVISTIKEILQEIYHLNGKLHIQGAASTGYGEELIRNGFGLDGGVVETMAHLMAAKKLMPQVDFIIDIGGQDMKCFKIWQGEIDTIFLNEACSSGCGSFISTFASSLGYSVEDFVKIGLYAQNPVDLGSRCTVFMNSSVKQAQKEGASVADISAGLSISVVKNALYKVIRIANKEELGKNILVQGGTFLNDGILRAFEQHVDATVVRPAMAGLMGAYGAALYIKEQGGPASSILTLQQLNDFEDHITEEVCQYCKNHCPLTIHSFSNGQKLISGNRCQRLLASENDTQQSKEYNTFQWKRQAIMNKVSKQGKKGKIGIPMGLNMYENYHFWHPILTELGYEVVMSPFGNRDLYLQGQSTIPSDTICYPAKLMHGHMKYLIDKGIEKIFYPCMCYNFDEEAGSNHYNCPVVAYYPEVLKANMDEVESIQFIMDYLGPHHKNYFIKRLHQVLRPYDSFSMKELRRAVELGYQSYADYKEKLQQYGQQAIDYAREVGKPIIVLAARPYHIDPEVNHGIDRLITSYGAVVISEDCLPMQGGKVGVNILNQWTYHARLYHTAQYVAQQNDMYLVQIVSFGCGLDGITSDEVRDILERNGKLYTQIKIDEIQNLGAVKIRLRSLFATMERRKVWV